MIKPYYDDGNGIVIYHGDCRDILPHLPKVDLVLTDPPYGIGWNTNYSRFSRGTADKPSVRNDDTPFSPEVLLSFDEVITWGANHYAQKLPPASWLVWDKRNLDGTAFLSDAEVAWWSEGHGIYLYSISGQWHRSVSGGLHPTQKPVGLMKWCIGKAKTSGTICDPYMGSGSTLVAAKNLGRKAIGIEIEERYVKIAIERLSQEVLAL